MEGTKGNVPARRLEYKMVKWLEKKILGGEERIYQREEVDAGASNVDGSGQRPEK